MRAVVWYPAKMQWLLPIAVMRMAGLATTAGAGPEAVRLSIGIETVDDLIADLDQSLTRATRAQAAE